MRRLLQKTLILGVLCSLMIGCGEPRYGYYGSPGYGYVPYSYGWSNYGRGYAPAFNDRHSWEEHHGNEGHHDSFAHFGGGGHPGGFGGEGHMGGFGGGRGGGGHSGGGHR